jgi:hypothetical protein
MKTLKSLVLCILLFATLNPVISRAGTYSNSAAYYFQISQYYRAQATWYALTNSGSSYYDYSVWSNAYSAYSNANSGYTYANWQYLYANSSLNCYYAQYYAYYAQYYANNAQWYAWYKYVGYPYGADVVSNNYYADYNGSLANQYLFYCG